MKSVVTVFERNPENDHTGILFGVFTTKDVALASLTESCLSGEQWAKDQNTQHPGLGAEFSNRFYTVSEDILHDGTPVDSDEFFDFHQNKRYFQKFNWNGTELEPTSGVSIAYTWDEF